MSNKKSVESECERLAMNLLLARRTDNSDELAYWLTYAARIGYQLGYLNGSNNEPISPPESIHIPQLCPK